jgi:ubiquitin C-terminal hydrolase
MTNFQYYLPDAPVHHVQQGLNICIMISEKDLTSLRTILNEERSLNEISASFHRIFAKSRYDQFNLGCTLHILIDEELLLPNERIAALFLLYDIYKLDQITSNPFLIFFLDLLQSETSSINEKNIILQLLGQPNKEVRKNKNIFEFNYFFN